MMQLARRKSSNYEVVGGTGGYTSIDSSADRQGERLVKEDFNQKRTQELSGKRASRTGRNYDRGSEQKFSARQRHYKTQRDID